MRSAVVTGASSGIGHATVKLLVEREWRVFANVRSQADAGRLVDEFGSRIRPLIFDVRDQDAVLDAAVAARADLEGRTLDGLVNNAGIGITGPVLHQPLDEIRAQIDTNFTAMFGTIQAFGPLLGADRSLEGPRGRIVNVSSIGGIMGQPFGAAYCAAKHGVEGMSEALRRELRREGIKVIVVAPTVVETAIWDKDLARGLDRYDDTPYAEAYRKGVGALIESGRKDGMPPEEVAEAIWTALTASRPRHRYAPSRNAFIENGLLRAVPDRLIDTFYASQLGLRRGSDEKRR